MKVLLRVRSWDEAGRRNQKAVNPAEAGRVKALFESLDWWEEKACYDKQRVEQLICRLGNADRCLEGGRVKAVRVKA